MQVSSKSPAFGSNVQDIKESARVVVMSPAALVAMCAQGMGEFDRELADRSSRQTGELAAQKALSDFSAELALFQKGFNASDGKTTPKQRAGMMAHLWSSYKKAESQIPADSPYRKTLEEVKGTLSFDEHHVTKNSDILDDRSDFERIQIRNARKDPNKEVIEVSPHRYQIVEYGNRNKMHAEEIKRCQDVLKNATDEISNNSQKTMAELNDLMSKRANLIEMTKNIATALLSGSTFITQNAPR